MTEGIMEFDHRRALAKKKADQVAVVCFSCRKVLRWIEVNEEAAEKKITDVKIWHQQFCTGGKPKKGR